MATRFMKDEFSFLLGASLVTSQPDVISAFEEIRRLQAQLRQAEAERDALRNAIQDVIAHISETRRAFEAKEKLDFGGFATGVVNVRWVEVRLIEPLESIAKTHTATPNSEAALSGKETK